MKKFFSILVITTLFSVTASAQTPEQTKQFVVNAFPAYMPGVVINETETIVVSEKTVRKFAKKNDTETYQYTNLQGQVYTAQIRIGDTVSVFKGVPYYSKGQSAYMSPLLEQKVVKAPKQKRAPRTAEQKQQDQQMVAQGINIVKNIILPKVIGNNATQTTGGLQRIGSY